MANGKNAYLLQVTIDSTNKWIDFDVDASGPFEVSIAVGEYSDMRAVCAAMQTAMQAEIGTMECYVEIGSDNIGHVVIEDTNSGALELFWKTGTHGSDNADSHIGTLFGFSDAADDDSASLFTSDNQHMHGWYDVIGPQFDSKPRVEKIGPATFVALSGKATRTTFPSPVRARTIRAVVRKKTWI